MPELAHEVDPPLLSAWNGFMGYGATQRGKAVSDCFNIEEGYGIEASIPCIGWTTLIVATSGLKMIGETVKLLLYNVGLETDVDGQQ